MTTPTPTHNALALATEIENIILDVANGRTKPGKIPLEPFVRAYAELRRLHAMSVEHVLLDVTPGDDGMGHEVYAKSVNDVIEALTKMGAKNEDLELERSGILERSGTMLKFYGVSTIADLISAQARHISRLQAKLPLGESAAPRNPREG